MKTMTMSAAGSWAGVCWLAAGIAAMAAEHTIEIRDWTGRGFAPDAVTYAVDSAKASRLRVWDAAGQPVAAQVTEAEAGKASLTFVTGLAPDSNVIFHAA